MNKLLQNWHPLRLLRLALGLAAIIQGFVSKDVFAGAMGIFLLATSIFNVSCCGIKDCSTGSCRVRSKAGQTNALKP